MRDTTDGAPPDAVSRYFDCINAERYDELLDLFLPDAEVRAPGTPPLVGREQIKQYYRKAFAPYPRHRDAPTRVIRCGPTVTVEIHFTGAVSGGATVDFDAVDVIDLAEDGRIARLTTWYDSHWVRRLLAEAQGTTP